MKTSQEEMIRQLHRSPWKMVLAVTGGGSRIIPALLSVPGGSQTLLEAVVPYANMSVDLFLHYKPEQYCSEYTARLLAMAAFQRAVVLDSGSIDHLLGIGVTASLVSDQPKKGDHRIHIAIQSQQHTAVFSLILKKGARNRSEEELFASELILNIIMFSINSMESISKKLKNLNYSEENIVISPCSYSMPIFPEEILNTKSCFVSPEWSALFFSSEESVNAICLDNGKEIVFRSLHVDGKALDDKTNVSGNHLIFPGSFRPIHEGHLKMITIAEEVSGQPVDLEISVRNVDKPPLDFIETVTRFNCIQRTVPNHSVWFTRFPLFVDKSAFFKNRTFMMGTDTLIRLGNPVYHGGTEESHQRIIKKIVDQGTHFLLFIRKKEGNIEHLDALPIREELKKLCQEIPSEKFLEDISSTELRYRGMNKYSINK